MSPENALDEILLTLRRRAIDIATQPEPAREFQFELIEESCRRSVEQVGLSRDRAMVQAGRMADFTRAVVEIIDAGKHDGASGQA
jgi:hypothetical protein